MEPVVVPPDEIIAKGKYIKSHRGHFVAVTVGDVVTVIDGDSRACFRDPEGAGRGHGHIWYRLISSGKTSEMQPSVQLRIDTNWARACRKRALPAEVTCTRTASLSSEQLERVALNRAEALRKRASMLIRPLPPVSWQHPVMPAEPSHVAPWDVDLPDVAFLRILNAHPRDRHITFLAGPHVYFVKGRRSLGSVTGLVHSLAQPFDASAVIDKMTRGSNWPRPGYLRSCWGQRELAKLQVIPQATELLSLLQSTQRDEPAICDCAKRLCILCPQAAAAVAGLSLSPEEIIHKWDSNRDEAARAGTWMHFTFEALAAPDMCTHKGNPFRNYGVFC